jgi:hypothetical protein
MTDEDPWAEGFNVFGELDVDDVPDDPFHIDDNRYNWLVTKAQFKTHELKDEQARTAAMNNGEPSLIYKAYFTVQVDEPTSEFHGKPLPLQFNIYPWLTRQKLEDMTDMERKGRIQENMSRFKEFARGIGLSESDFKELKPNTVATICVGNKFSAYLRNNNSNGRVYKNLSDYKEVEDAEPTDIFTEFAS